jgi:WD40 repeat protein
MVAQDQSGLAPATGRFDAFVSYRRIPADTSFVGRLEQELAARGKRLWVDRTSIEPAADWLQRIDRGIKASRAIIFVLTPESVASEQCLRELALAADLHKLIVPVLLRPVERDGLPSSITRLSWIDFSSRDVAAGVEEVIEALEGDLEWRDKHVRLMVRASDWADVGHDRGFVLRGGDLRAAEEWLGQAAAHARTPPTAQQTAYIMASRKVASRVQRTWQGALSVGLAISLTLAAVAFVQRNQAQTQARIANSRAMAAEAVAALPTDPSRSVALALEATKTSPTPEAEQALRLAVAQDRLRLVIRSSAGSQAQAAWNPVLPQIAVAAAPGVIELWNSGNGRITQLLRTGSTDSTSELEFDAKGSRLAALSVGGHVSIWDIGRNGAALSVPTGDLDDRIKSLTISGFYYGGHRGLRLKWQASDLLVYGNDLSNLLIHDVEADTTTTLLPLPSQYGVEEVTSTPHGLTAFSGTQLVLNGTTQLTLSPQPDNGPACWFPDGSALVTSNGAMSGGPERIYSASTGRQIAILQSPGGATTAVTCSASPANEWVAAGGNAGDAILRTATGAVLSLSGSGATDGIVSSPDGRYLATVGLDGTTRVWDATSGQLISVLAGGEGGNGTQFGADSSLALTVDQSGLVRVWDTGVGPATVLQAPATGEAYPLQFSASGESVAGIDVTTSMSPAPRVTSAAMVSWNAGTGKLVHSIALPGITAAPVPCSRAISELALGSIGGSPCSIPPPSRLSIPVPVLAPGSADPDSAPTVSLPVAVSQDGRYVAYARPASVSVISMQGHPAATLRLRGTATGLMFVRNSSELLVMTETAIYLWWPLSSQPPAVFPQASAPIDVVLSASGTELAVADVAGTVEVWHVGTRSLARTFGLVYCKSKNDNNAYCPPAPTPVRVALSPDGDVVAAGDDYGGVFFWSTVTGKRLALREVSSWPLLGLTSTTSGLLLATDWPMTPTAAGSEGTSSLLDFGTQRVTASYLSPRPYGPPINPGAVLSPDGRYLFSGALGVAPTWPGGQVAVYQVAGGQVMASLHAAQVPHTTADPEFPAQPWSPDGGRLVVGNGIYRCDACVSLNELQALATTRIAWSAPLSEASDHPPASDPYV